MELKQADERADDQCHFQLSEVFSGADARAMTETEMQAFLGKTVLAVRTLPTFGNEFGCREACG